MSKDRTQPKKNPLATIFGALAAGVAGGAYFHKKLADQFIHDIHNENSEFHVLHGASLQKAKVQELIDAHPGALPYETQQEVAALANAASNHETPYFREVMQDAQMVGHSEAYQQGLAKLQATERYRQLEDARDALHRIEHRAHEISQVQFHQLKGVPTLEVVMRGGDLHTAADGSMSVVNNSFSAPNIHPPKGVSLIESAGKKGVFVLNPEEIEGLAHQHPEWFKNAKSTLLDAEKAFERDYAQLFRKAAPKGWAWKRMGDASQATVIGAGLVCAVVGGLIAQSLGARHKDRVEQKRTAEAAKDSPFAGV